jgi:hypothetical protein
MYVDIKIEEAPRVKKNKTKIKQNWKLLCVLKLGYDEAGNLRFRACLVVFLSWSFVMYLTGPKFDV